MVVMLDVPSNTRTLIVSAVYMEDGVAKSERKIIRTGELGKYVLSDTEKEWKNESNQM